MILAERDHPSSRLEQDVIITMNDYRVQFPRIHLVVRNTCAYNLIETVTDISQNRRLGYVTQLQARRSPQVPVLLLREVQAKTIDRVVNADKGKTDVICPYPHTAKRELTLMIILTIWLSPTSQIIDDKIMYLS